MTRRRLLIGAGASTFAGVLLGVIALIALNASLLSIPLPVDWKGRPGREDTGRARKGPGSKEYNAITERNLFRAKLQAEIPKPRSEKEIEEEMLVSILTPMTLKGVMTGHHNKDLFRRDRQGRPERCMDIRNRRNNRTGSRDNRDQERCGCHRKR